MKQLIGAAVLALAFTGTASAYDDYSNNNSGYDDSYAVEKPDYQEKKPDHRADIKVWEDPNPSKLKRELDFFEQFTVRD